MAICANDTAKLIGRNAGLELADGCADTVPLESEWLYAGALTTKGFDFSPNTVTSDADDTGGFQESLVTNSDFTISTEGEVRVADKSDEYGFGRMVKYFPQEIKARRQPSLWVRLTIGEIVFVGYMTITALSGDFGTNDIGTFSLELKVADSDTVSITDTGDIRVTSVSLTPTTSTVAVGANTTFTVTVLPANATNKTFTAISSVPARATATISGTTVTVASPSSATAGTAVITVSTTDGAFTANHTVTVTA